MTITDEERDEARRVDDRATPPTPPAQDRRAVVFTDEDGVLILRCSDGTEVPIMW